MIGELLNEVCKYILSCLVVVVVVCLFVFVDFCFDRSPTFLYTYICFTIEMYITMGNICKRRGDLMRVVSGSSGPNSRAGRGHCVVFLGKTRYSHSASLHPGVESELSGQPDKNARG